MLVKMMVNPRKNPKFKKQGSNYLKRVKDRWRKPRGRDSKLRKKEKSKGKIPCPGYRAPKNTRGLHPSGLEEVYIQNIKDLDKIDPKTQAARLSSTLGKRKREEIIKMSEERKIRILNP